MEFQQCELHTLGGISLRVRLENQVCLWCRSPAPKAECGWGVPSTHRTCSAQEICWGLYQCVQLEGWATEMVRVWNSFLCVHPPWRLLCHTSLRALPSTCRHCLFQSFQSRTELPQVSPAVCGTEPGSLAREPALPKGCSPPFPGQVGLED